MVTNKLVSYLAYTPVDEPINEVSTEIVNTFANLVNTELIGKLLPNSLDKNLIITSNFVTKLKDSQSIATFINFLNLLTSTISKEDFFKLQIYGIALGGTNSRSKKKDIGNDLELDNLINDVLTTSCTYNVTDCVLFGTFFNILQNK